MRIGHYTDKRNEPQNKAGFRGAYMRCLIAHEEGAQNFYMRLVTIEPGGLICLHQHNYEHEIFVLKGLGYVISEHKEHDIKHVYFLFISPEEKHGFKNTGSDVLELICCIPNPD